MSKYEEEWNSVWSKNNTISKAINKGRNFYNQRFIKLFRSSFDKNKSFLEIGCGTSSLLLSMALHFKKVTGLDLSDEALKISKKNAAKMKVKNATFVKGDCFNIPFKDNTFDIVWSQGLIEHFPNPKKVVEEHYRVCKKGGLIIISTPLKYSYQHLWYIITRLRFLRQFWPWTDQDFYTKKKYQNLISDKNWKHKISYLPGDLTRTFIILKIKK